MSVNLEKPLHVCLGALLFHPRYSGPALRFKRYAPGLCARGVSFRVFTTLLEDGTDGETRPRGSADGAEPSYLIDGIPVHGVRVSLRKGRRRMVATHALELARFCRRQRPRPAVVQLLDLTTWALRGLIRLRGTGIPIVYTHSIIEPTGEGLKERLLERYRTVPYRLVDCVVVSSTAMRDALREAGIRSRIEIIPNGVDLNRFRPVAPPARARLRERLGLRPNGQVVVFVGGFLGPRKGLDVLAHAWTRIARGRPQVQLVLVGPHRDPLRPDEPQSRFLREIAAILAESDAQDRVIFTGEISNVEEYLQAADVFAFPSRLEGMPNVVLEAFATGAPSVLTPFIGLSPEFGRPDEHYVLSENTPEALAAAIETMLEDPGRREGFARRARLWVQQNLDVQASLDRYAALYHELAAHTLSA